jgi:signal transduction histidine kinase
MAWQLSFWGLDALAILSDSVTVRTGARHVSENATRGETTVGLSLSDFVAAAAHDLSAPLFSILGLTQLLLDDKAPDEATRHEFLTIIHRQATQLSHIVSDLRDLSALDAGAPISLDLEPVLPIMLVDDVVARAKPVASDKRISLAVRIASDLPPIQTDRGRATQVLDNLLDNALKFTPSGGAVEISAEPGDTSDFVRIAVRDSGIGMSPEVVSHVFERFFRLEPSSAEGTGLGLYISKQLVRLLGGEIGVVSKLGEGSTLWIELPNHLVA